RAGSWSACLSTCARWCRSNHGFTRGLRMRATLPGMGGDGTTVELVARRAYDGPARGDGRRVLVDRVWPRGVSKEALAADAWVKDGAPSDGLRKWFNHDPERWDEFRERYFKELDGNPEGLEALYRELRG